MNKKALIIIVVGVFVVGGSLGFLLLNKDKDESTPPPLPLPPPMKPASVSEVTKAVVDVAIPKSKKWREDAEPVIMNINLVNEGNYDTMSIIFSSPNTTDDIGYKIEMAGNEIVSEKEVVFYDSRKGGALEAAIGAGEKVPVEDLARFYPSCGGVLLQIIPLNEAIENMHKIKGYEDEKVTEVEAICGPEGLTWYWGLLTSQGSVTVKANK